MLLLQGPEGEFRQVAPPPLEKIASVFSPSFVDAVASLLTTSFFSPDEEEDEEEVYKMAGVMAQCGGLGCMLNRLTGIRDFKQGRHLLTVSCVQLPFLSEVLFWLKGGKVV